MSSTVDERIVEMTFDNKQFEQGVDSTVKSLDELKKSLKFDNVGGGLDDFKKSLNGIDLSRVTDALDAVISKFSFFGTIKDQILRDFTSFIDNKVIGSLESMVKAMTIDISAISSGFSEYETKMNAIQVLKSSVIGTGDIGITITPEVDQAAKDIIYNGLYGTGAERKAVLEEMGLDYAAVQSRVDEIVANNWQWVESANGVAYTMDDINATLDTMNEYADKTIYNFPQMTENLGKFTTAGVDLKTAEKAIIGLSNLAASAGADATQMAQATYQMSQAMSSGMIRLMDWNSLAQRSMDTAQFKKVILAVAEKQGVATEMLAKANENFRDSLSEEWLTSDIFNEALAVYSDRTTAASYGFEGVYDMAMEAAQRIRTFTMLKDTITEQIQSGWTESWEYIIGDSEEAAVALTRLNDVIANLLQPTMEARNSMLEFWHDFGGREAVVNGLFNILDAFTKALSTVKTAWREIFPKEGRGGKLVAYSKAFEAFTEKLIMGRDTADKVRRTFKGLFAAFDIGINIITSLFCALSPVFDLFKKNKGEKGLLDYTASLGDFLVALHDGAIETDFFYNIFSTVVNFILSVPSKIKEAINKLSEYFGVDFVSIFQKAYEVVKEFVVSIASKIAELAGVDTSGVGDFANGVKEKLSPLAAIGAFLSGVWEVLSAVAKKVGPILSALWTVISAGMSKVKDALLVGIGNADVNSIVDLILSGALISLILKVKEAISNFSGIGGSIKGVFSGISEVIDGIKGSLEAFTIDVKANALLKIAAAVAVLAVSLWGISKLDPEALAIALSAVGASFAELIITMKALASSSISIVVTATALIMIATAIDILTLSLVALSLIDPKSLGKGIAAIAAIMLVLTKGISTINESGRTSITTAAAIVVLAGALLELTGIVAILGVMSNQMLIKGILGLSAILLVFTNAIWQLGECCGKVNASVLGTIIVLSNAILKLTGALAILGHMDISQLAYGSLALVVVMEALTMTIEKLAKVKPNSLVSISIAITTLSNSCVILALALRLLSSVSFTSLVASTASLSTIIFAFVEASKLADKSDKAMTKLSASLVTLGVSLLIISKALSSLSGEDPGKLMSVAGVLSSVILVLVLALNSMDKAKGASSMIKMSVALLIMSAALKSLSDVAGSDLIKGLMAMAAMSGILVALSYALSKWGEGLSNLSTSSLKFSAALLVFSVALGVLVPSLEKLSNLSWKQLAKIGVALAGLLVVALAMGGIGTIAGAGILAFSAGLAVFSLSVLALSASLSLLVGVMTKLAAADLTNLGENFKVLFTTIIDNAPLIAEAITTVLVSIISSVPVLVETFFSVLEDSLNSIDQHLEPILVSLFSILVTIISYLADNIGPLVEGLLNIVANIFYGMAAGIGTVADSIVVFVIALINGISDAIIEHRGEIADALILAVVAAFLALGTVFEKLGDLLGDALSAIWEFGKTIAVKIVRGFKNGVVALWTWFTDLPTNIGNILTSLWEDIKEIGGYLLDGLVEGLCNLGDKIKDFCNMVWQAIKDFFGISSPSKLMEEAGGYMVDGLANGLNDDGTAVDATENLCGDINDTFSSNMDDIFNADNYSFDLNSLVGENGEFITPVMDMDTITAQMSDFTSGQSMSINASMNDQLSSQVASSMSDYTDYSEKVVNEISKLRTDVNAINTRLDGISVVLDTGALVGQLTTPINAQLGRLLAMSQRGLFK